MSGSRLLAWLLLAVNCIAVAGALTLGGKFGLVEIASLLIVLTASGVGTLIITRLGSHAVGWALLAVATGFSLGGILVTLVESMTPIPLTPYLAVAGNWSYALGVSGAALLLLFFPTGSLPTPRWRPLVWSVSVGALLMMAGSLVDPTSFDDFPVENPWALPADNQLPRIIGQAGVALLLIGIVGGVVSIVIRMRRGDETERRQLKFVMLAVVVAALGLGFVSITDSLAGGGLSDDMGNFIITLALTLIPVSMGLAIFRYRLYDIDRIISRTVSYTLVLGVLALVILGLVALLAAFLPSEDPLAVAIATLAAAALFNPLRRRVQAVVDRRFNRSRYDAERVLNGFAGSLQDCVDPDDVVTGWVDVVKTTMQPNAVGVWVKQGG